MLSKTVLLYRVNHILPDTNANKENAADPTNVLHLAILLSYFIRLVILECFQKPAQRRLLQEQSLEFNLPYLPYPYRKYHVIF